MLWPEDAYSGGRWAARLDPVTEVTLNRRCWLGLKDKPSHLCPGLCLAQHGTGAKSSSQPAEP